MKIIGPEIRLEHCYSVWREKGQRHGELHGGGPRQAESNLRVSRQQRANSRWNGARRL